MNTAATLETLEEYRRLQFLHLPISIRGKLQQRIQPPPVSEMDKWNFERNCTGLTVDEILYEVMPNMEDRFSASLQAQAMRMCRREGYNNVTASKLIGDVTRLRKAMGICKKRKVITRRKEF